MRSFANEILISEKLKHHQCFMPQLNISYSIVSGFVKNTSVLRLLYLTLMVFTIATYALAHGSCPPLENNIALCQNSVTLFSDNPNFVQDMKPKNPATESKESTSRESSLHMCECVSLSIPTIHTTSVEKIEISSFTTFQLKKHLFQWISRIERPPICEFGKSYT